MEIETVNAGAYALAFTGGVVSFLSPCVLPMVPGYLSLITGTDIAALGDAPRRRRLAVLRDTSLFVAGFTAVFVLLGLTATSVGRVFSDNQAILVRLSGALVLAMGFFLLGSLVLQAPWLYQEKRFHPSVGRWGRAGPPVAGVAFGFGWSPCIGPVLASITAIAATSGRWAAGGTLMAVYSLGLGLPFLVVGLAFSRVGASMRSVNRHMPKLVVMSGVVLVVFGTLLVFDRLAWLSTELLEALEGTPLQWLVDLG
jgi:cytochrome c-type biogenesis protein